MFCSLTVGNLIDLFLFGGYSTVLLCYVCPAGFFALVIFFTVFTGLLVIC